MELIRPMKDEMLAKLARLVRHNSRQGEALEGKPFGEGPAAALAEALEIGREMGFRSPKAYEQAAGEVAENRKSLHKKQRDDGDDVYFLESGNDFVVVSGDGYIRTYFWPDSGKVTWIIQGKEYTIAEMEQANEIMWPMTEAATIRVQLPGGLSQGYHDVEMHYFISHSYSSCRF